MGASQNSDANKARSLMEIAQSALGDITNVPDKEHIDRINSMKPALPLKSEERLVTHKATAEQSTFLREIVVNYHDKMLTHDAHVARERALASTEHAQRCIHTWVLTPEGDMDGTDIRCSLRLVDNEIFLAQPGEAVKTVSSFYAGACATALQHRKRGYARQLLNDLAGKYKPRSTDGTIACQWISNADALFAHIKPTVTPSLRCNLTVDNFQQATDEEMKSVNFIHESDLEAVCDAGNKYLCSKIEAMSNTEQKNVIVIKMDSERIRYRCMESRLKLTLTDTLPSLDEESLQICGASIGKPTDEDYAYVMWNLRRRNLSRAESVLVIVLSKFQTSQQLKLLLTAALKITQSWGLPAGLYWLLDSRNAEYLQDLNISYREAGENDTIMSLLALGSSKNRDEIHVKTHTFYTAEIYGE